MSRLQNAAAIRRSMGFGDFGNRCTKIKSRWFLTIETDDWSISTQPKKSLPCLFPMKTGRPGIQFKEFPVEHLVETIYFPAKPDWKTITVMCYDTADYRQMHPLMSWLMRKYNPAAGPTGRAWFNDKCDAVNSNFKIPEVLLELRDGCGALQEMWIFVEVWPNNIEFGEMEYSGNEYVTCEMTLRYSRAVFESLQNTAVQRAKEEAFRQQISQMQQNRDRFVGQTEANRQAAEDEQQRNVLDKQMRDLANKRAPVHNEKVPEDIRKVCQNANTITNGDSSKSLPPFIDMTSEQQTQAARDMSSALKQYSLDQAYDHYLQTVMENNRQLSNLVGTNSPELEQALRQANEDALKQYQDFASWLNSFNPNPPAIPLLPQDALDQIKSHYPEPSIFNGASECVGKAQTHITNSATTKPDYDNDKSQAADTNNKSQGYYSNMVKAAQGAQYYDKQPILPYLTSFVKNELASVGNRLLSGAYEQRAQTILDYTNGKITKEQADDIVDNIDAMIDNITTRAQQLMSEINAAGNSLDSSMIDRVVSEMNRELRPGYEGLKYVPDPSLARWRDQFAKWLKTR